MENTEFQPTNSNTEDFGAILDSINKKSEEMKSIERLKKEIKELEALMAKVESKKLKIRNLKEKANI
ncbi:hypothetical protein [uncultured Helicobacter sp.]|uniref:hypothetical protein n=1 Tax=uncultured Helicobacter sp. TaxID=175537 RepID=UPI00374F018E